MAVELDKLKELRFPRYLKGASWEDYSIKLLSAASTRGRAAEAMRGDFMQLMPAWTVGATGARTRGTLDADQQAM